MTREERIFCLASLGTYLRELPDTEKRELFAHAAAKNAWFTEENISLAIDGIIYLLQIDHLVTWAGFYGAPAAPKKVGIIMAGNIPLVGFHDLLCVLISGHSAVIKLSTHDNVLPTFVIAALGKADERILKYIEVVEKLASVDAVIATGSDNSSRYFKKYFGTKPHIIRQNRTSVAILTGHETPEELRLLGNDMFTYFGMGCRNVAKLYIPDNYDLVGLIPYFDKHQGIINHSKYFNNYEYNKAIYLVNREAHLDNGFALFKESSELVSPLSVVYFEKYSSTSELAQHLKINAAKLQCIVGRPELNDAISVEFGNTQYPNLNDYADNVDTMAFLAEV